jgi:hypothetical protein
LIKANAEKERKEEQEEAERRQAIVLAEEKR